jgi:hypothetical protein
VRRCGLREGYGGGIARVRVQWGSEAVLVEAALCGCADEVWLCCVVFCLWLCGAVWCGCCVLFYMRA